MSYETLHKACTSNPVAARCACSLLFSIGRQGLEDEPAILSDLSAMPMAEGFKQDVIDILRDLQKASDRDIFILVQRDIPKINLPGEDRDGICPVCGDTVEYNGDQHILDECTEVTWACPNCGATGKSYYNLVFDQHDDVYDGQGDKV